MREGKREICRSGGVSSAEERIAAAQEGRKLGWLREEHHSDPPVSNALLQPDEGRLRHTLFASHGTGMSGTADGKGTEGWEGERKSSGASPPSTTKQQAGHHE